MSSNPHGERLLHIGVCLLVVSLFVSCSQPKRRSNPEPPPHSIRYASAPIGELPQGQPWIAHVKSTDLDQDGLTDFVACDAKLNTVFWIRQTKPGVYEESLLANDMPAPVHIEPADIDGDGDIDLLVACMSFIFPNNDKIGTIIALENLGRGNFRKRVLLDQVARVSDVRAADFDHDGDLDLAVGQFGYDQGEIRWMRQTSPWQFESETLLQLSGAINVCVADFNQDGHPDIAAQLSQQWEEIHLFENDGNGDFTRRVLWGSTNEDYASSGMTVCDLNQDGLPDLLFSNGDGFGPTPVPGPRPWHGVQWLENQGQGKFQYRRIGDLPGAFSPKAVDFDHDGDLDVIAVSSFNNWSDPKAESLVWFENLNDNAFRRHTLANHPIQLLSIEVGDFDNSGELDIVSGGFHAYPPYERMSRILLWKKTSPQP